MTYDDPDEIWTARAQCRRCAWETMTDCTGMSSSEIAQVTEKHRQKLIKHYDVAHPEIARLNRPAP
jgi:hypothetical protein